MGEALLKLRKASEQVDRLNDRPRDDGLNPQERRALRVMRREAAAAGSKLTSGGKGGLPPSLVLGVMRRDKYRCKTCGELGSDQNGGLGVHHRGGIVASKWLSRQGHQNKPANIVSICNSCHDRLHEKARAEGNDSSQVLPEGDEGTKRDKGDRPVAHPEA